MSTEDSLEILKTAGFLDGRFGRKEQSQVQAYLIEYERGRTIREIALAPRQCQRSWARSDNSGDGSS